ncbi:hypothetical protein ABT040_29875 [Streptomyces sp. NPDC002688]|uniref:hypothetical protein n=1 Tax=Streptomyces sp. NPDC002688 TaxID=3154423 RepID=UPI00332DB6DA
MPQPQNVQTRLSELRQEYRLGEEQLGHLVRNEAELRETLLRISGAVQVLEEMTRPDGESGNGSPDGARQDASTEARAGRGS